MNKKKFIHSILEKADIKVGGSRPQDIQINNDILYSEAFRGTLGLGESYMRGEWESNNLEETVFKFYSTKMDDVFKPNIITLYSIIKAHLFNPQVPKKAVEQIKSHFDRDPSMYKSMLGRTMAYTCAFYREKNMNLDEAQDAKLDLICKKLNLKQSDHILDIGCGWGSFAFYAARKYGCKVTGVTISQKQFEYCKENKIEDKVNIVLADYRKTELYNPDNIKYDKITAIGVMEHLGITNLNIFNEVAYKQLKDEGLFLLHTIGTNHRNLNADKWMDKYIFPGGDLATIDQISRASTDNVKFYLEHFENLGTHYVKTLEEWFSNFDQYWNSSQNSNNEEFDSFYKMWKFYLLSCAAAFRAKRLSLWHFVFSKNLPTKYNFSRITG